MNGLVPVSTHRWPGEPDATGTGTGVRRRGVRPAGGTAWAIGAAKSATGAPLLAVESQARADVPSLRYLVHLSAPGWNVAGATSPWLPGVIIGHNERIAWGMAAAARDTQDIFVERLNPDDPHQVERHGRWVDMAVDRERVDVKGRAKPVEYERMYPSNGVVIALDKERNLVYTLKWSGTEPGGAGELAALAIDRAASSAEFRQAVARWKMPTADFVYADVDGHIASLQAGLSPVRPDGSGAIPAAGWTGARAWRGWEDARPMDLDPTGAAVIAADHSAPRTARISQLLAETGTRSADDLRRMQLDVVSSNASTLRPLLDAVRPFPAELLPFRTRLQAWNGAVSAGFAEAALYVEWEASVRDALAAGRVPQEFVQELAGYLDVVSIVTHPSTAWFDGAVADARDRLLVDAFRRAVEREGTAATSQGSSQALNQVTFQHPLAVFEQARRRFNVGPFPMSGYADTSSATDGVSGPAFRAIVDLSDWNRTLVTNAPGQSGSPSSLHYDDLAKPWADGNYIPLPFSAAAVREAASDTLVLGPR